jgi:hypothetical protein
MPNQELTMFSVQVYIFSIHVEDHEIEIHLNKYFINIKIKIFKSYLYLKIYMYCYYVQIRLYIGFMEQFYWHNFFFTSHQAIDVDIYTNKGIQCLWETIHMHKKVNF